MKLFASFQIIVYCLLPVFEIIHEHFFQRLTVLLVSFFSQAGIRIGYRCLGSLVSSTTLNTNKPYTPFCRNGIFNFKFFGLILCNRPKIIFTIMTFRQKHHVFSNMLLIEINDPRLPAGSPFHFKQRTEKWEYLFHGSMY